MVMDRFHRRLSEGDLCARASHVAGSWITLRARGRISSPPAPHVVSLSHQCRELTAPHSRGAQLHPPGHAAQGHKQVDGMGPSTGGTEVVWSCCAQTAWVASVGNPTGACEQLAWVLGSFAARATLPPFPSAHGCCNPPRVAAAWQWRGCAAVHTHACSGFAQDGETRGVPGVCRGEVGCRGWIWQHPGSRQVVGMRPGMSCTARASLGFHPASASRHHAGCVSDSLL